MVRGGWEVVVECGGDECRFLRVDLSQFISIVGRQVVVGWRKGDGAVGSLDLFGRDRASVVGVRGG
jgi:hypothetical protein